MSEPENPTPATPEQRVVAPPGVRQAQQRATRAAAGIHLRSRRNPKRLPQPEGPNPAS